MKRLISTIVLAGVLFGASVVATQAQNATGNDVNVPAGPSRANPLDKLHTVGNSAGYGSADQTTLFTVIGNSISILLGLLGIIFIILILIAGFNWMTAAGEEEKIKKAGQTIRHAVTGLIIVVAAFAIWMFISNIIVGDPSTSSPSNPALIGS